MPFDVYCPHVFNIIFVRVQGTVRLSGGGETQLLLAWEKTQLKNLEEKKTQQSVGQEKKTQREFSARGPPRSLMVRPLECKGNRRQKSNSCLCT